MASLLGACTPDTPPAPDAAGPVAAPEAAPAAGLPPPVEAAPVAPVREEEAIAALERMGKALRALQTFALEARTSTDYVADDGQKIAVDGTAAYRVQAPDRLFARVANDRQQREFYYDGKTLTLWSPRLRYYTVIDAVPPDIGELVAQASAQGVDLPLPDLFLWGTAQAPLENVTSARLVGPAMVDGVQADHYAYRQAGSDWQVWIARNTGLPAKLLITSVDEPAQPSYAARLAWKTGAAAGPVATFQPAADARRIEFVPVTGAAGQES